MKDYRQILLTMLEADGVKQELFNKYSLFLAKVENDSFVRGRLFERDGKIGAIMPPNETGLKHDQNDVISIQDAEFGRLMIDSQEQDTENYVH